MIEDTLNGAIQAVMDGVSRNLPDSLHWLLAPLRRVLDYVSGPVLGYPGRFPWWGLIAAAAIASIAFLYDRSRRPGIREAGFWAFLFPLSVYRNPSAWVDLKVGFCNHILFGGGAINLTWRLSGAFFASSVTVLLTAYLGPRGHAQAWGPTAVVVLTVAMSMASDFGYFLFHWAAHKFPPLWAIHKLHHSAEVMTPLTAARVHPLERLVMGPMMALTGALIMGPILYLYAGVASTATVFGIDILAVVFFTLGHNLHHSHVWVYYGPFVGWFIVSPAQHQIHHSSAPRHLDRNFAEHWAFWDTIFGTLYLPKSRESLTLGLAGYQTQQHTGVLSAWFKPVAESASLTFGSVTKAAALPRRMLRRKNAPTSLAAGPEPHAGA